MIDEMGIQTIIWDNDAQLDEERGYWLGGLKIEDIEPITEGMAHKKETRAGKFVTIGGVEYLIFSHRISMNSKSEILIRAEVMASPD